MPQSSPLYHCPLSTSARESVPDGDDETDGGCHIKDATAATDPNDRATIADNRPVQELPGHRPAGEAGQIAHEEQAKASQGQDRWHGFSILANQQDYGDHYSRQVSQQNRNRWEYVDEHTYLTHIASPFSD
jgi:hypothetical protein